MKVWIVIFLSALLLRVVNILFHNLDISQYLYEDQYLYWDWASKGAYTSWSTMAPETLTERMPGIFWFYEMLMWAFGKSLFLILLTQGVLDSLTCVIMSKSAKIIEKDLESIVGFLAVISPTMIISSSQILSDTLYLFFFSISVYFFLKSYYEKLILSSIISGLMLGISALIRVSSYPLIILSVLVLFLSNFIKGRSKLKIVFAASLFFLFALIPISSHLKNNIVNYNTLALTSQTGAHLSYWFLPNILSISKGYDREKSLKIINERINSKGGLTKNPYQNSKVRSVVAIQMLSEQNIGHIIYSFGRAATINIFSSALLIDQRTRSLPHPSFINSHSITQWLNTISNNKYFFSYFLLLGFSLLMTLILIPLTISGFIIFLFKDLYLTALSCMLIIFFILITGPNISPKYVLPYISIIFLWQASAIKYFMDYYKRKINNQST